MTQRGHIVVTLALGLLVAATPARAQKSPEEVKARMLVEFARYTTWPAEKFAKPDSPIVIGVMGDDDLFDALAALVKAEAPKVNGRPVEFRKIAPLDAERDADRIKEQAKSLHVLYIGGRNIRAALRAVDGQPLLTVSQAPRFVEEGGMIGLFIDKGYFRFDINKMTIDRAVLKVSSNVLKLARRVIQAEE